MPLFSYVKLTSKTELLSTLRHKDTQCTGSEDDAHHVLFHHPMARMCKASYFWRIGTIF